MTKQHFHQLFSRVYLGSAGLCLLFYIWSEYDHLSHAGAGPFAFLRHWHHLVDSALILFALPALITAVIMSLVRLTNHVEPLTEEQRRMSFVERLSVIQLFLPLSLLLFIPAAFLIIPADMYTPAGLIYLFIAVHAPVTWLLILWLRRIARIRKIGWKIVSILLFIVAVAGYGIVPPSALFLYSETETDYRLSLGISDNEEDAETDDPDADLAQMPQEELASNIARRALEMYDFYDGDPLLLLDAAKSLFQYDPNRQYINLVMGTSDMTREEIDRRSAEQRKNFERRQELGRYCQWARNNLDYDELETLAGFVKKALLRQSDRYDYSLFAKRIDMLDVAYRELMVQGSELYDEAEAHFYDIYQYASETPLFWENYGRFISNPYIRYTAEGNNEGQELLLWAYTFWGRRYDEGNYWYCRILLDKILEAYPNTLYPPEKLEKQNALMRDAEARVTEFFKWYKANYWSFRELKAARYDDDGSLVKLDLEEYGKYLHALEASGYLSPGLLRKLEIPENNGADSVKTGNVRERHGEWLRTDPLLGNYNTVANAIDSLICRTEQIREPGQEMRIATSIENLRADVECIDGKWFICGILTENE